jgi:hypothetical protein
MPAIQQIASLSKASTKGESAISKGTTGPFARNAPRMAPSEADDSVVASNKKEKHKKHKKGHRDEENFQSEKGGSFSVSEDTLTTEAPRDKKKKAKKQANSSGKLTLPDPSSVFNYSGSKKPIFQDQPKMHACPEQYAYAFQNRNSPPTIRRTQLFVVVHADFGCKHMQHMIFVLWPCTRRSRECQIGL